MIKIYICDVIETELTLSNDFSSNFLCFNEKNADNIIFYIQVVSFML